MTTAFKIGKADPNNGRSGGRTFHKLVRGDNFFRILPPVHGFADTGRWAQYYAKHMFQNTKGNWMSFQCIEERDFNTKMTTRHCPLCDKAADGKKKYDMLKVELDKGNPNVTKEILSAFNEAWVRPFQADRKYYVNAIDGEGKIGILPLPSKLFNSLKALHQANNQRGFDLMDIKGAYVKLGKVSRYDGDPQVTYSADLAMDQGNDGSFRIRYHELTQQVLEAVAKQAADLSDVYKVITVEQIASIAAAPNPDERKKIIDAVFPRQEQKSDEGATAETILAGTAPTAPAGGQFQDVSALLGSIPATPPAAPAPQAAPTIAPATPAPAAAFTPPPSPAPQAAPAPAVTSQTSLSAAPSQDVGAMTPEQFAAFFNSGT